MSVAAAMSQPQRQHTTMMIVPTGVGAAIGGYAGDALPVARAIATVTDRLITHPNVLNGAQLYWPLANAYYVEGYGLDQFAACRWHLQPVHQNAIGLVFDQAIEADLRWRHLQAADAARATLGLNITGYVTTDAPLGVRLSQAQAATWGTLARPDSLLRAVEHLLQSGCTAIAVIARFPDDGDSDALTAYRDGGGRIRGLLPRNWAILFYPVCWQGLAARRNLLPLPRPTALASARWMPSWCQRAAWGAVPCSASAAPPPKLSRSRITPPA